MFLSALLVLSMFIDVVFSNTFLYVLLVWKSLESSLAKHNDLPMVKIVPPTSSFIK